MTARAIARVLTRAAGRVSPAVRAGAVLVAVDLAGRALLTRAAGRAAWRTAAYVRDVIDAAEAEVTAAVNAGTEATNEQARDLYGVLHDMSKTLDEIRDQGAAL